MLLVGGDLRVLLADRCGTLIPVRHADRDAVGLRRNRQMPACAAAGQFEGKAQHAIGADARENRFLQDDFAISAFEHLAADRGVLALGVFAYDEEVDVAGLAVGQRTRYAVKKADRA